MKGAGLVLPRPGAPSALPGVYREFLRGTVLAFVSLGPSLPPALKARHRQACERVKRGLRADPAKVLERFSEPEICDAVRCAGAVARSSPFRARVDALLAQAVEALAAGRRPGRGALHPVADLGFLALQDPNPLSLFEAHPEKAGNAVSLGGRPLAEWLARLRKAAALICEHEAGLYEEMRLVLKRLVPVGYDAERHSSASYREAVGTVYLSLHPDVLTIADALIHEFQHNKLHAASYAEAFLENAFSPLYRSPVRPDPRPLWGILMAVHAFLPVAAFRRRLRDRAHPAAATAEFAARLGEIDRKNAEGLAVLRAHARWTAAGRELMRELEALHRRHWAELERRGEAAKPLAAHDD